MNSEVGLPPAPPPGRPAPPKDWLPGLKEHGKTDLVSGFIIFLIALPLCLAIAGASGAPPIAGIIAGIVAGTLANLCSGSFVTINGPAAGMIVIVVGAVEELGFDKALAVGVVTGAIQIVLSFLRAGKLTGFFPIAVVHGMLAGIGLIIMTGQIHIVLGRPNPREHSYHILTVIPESFRENVPAAALIGVVSIAIMIAWPIIGSKLGKIGKIVPAPLIAVIVGIVIAQVNDAKPRIDLGGGLIDGFTTPNFSGILSGPSLKWILLYVFVASLESLLTAEAVDKLDPYKRRSDMNRELFGKGVGNLVSSGIGGLPMIAEVVRSKANIISGAKTRWSNFFHGIFLLIFVLAVPSVLELIPVAALAGVLVVVGFKLAHPKEFLHAWHVDKINFVLMLVTALTVLFTDLLIGVAVGTVLGILYAVVRGTKLGNLFKARMAVAQDGDKVLVTLRGALGFHNFIKLRGALDTMPPAKQVTLDFSEATYIDPTVSERIHDFEEAYALDGGTVDRLGESHLRSDGPHPFSTKIASSAPR